MTWPSPDHFNYQVPPATWRPFFCKRGIMSYLTLVSKLFHALSRAVIVARAACHVIDRVDKYVQASNASDALKAQSTAVKASVHGLCEALAEYKAELPTHS